MEIVILHNQSLFDIAIQYTGSVMNTFQIGKANNLSLTADLVPGEKLIIPELDKDLDVKNYFESKKLQPATAITEVMESEGGEDLEGISIWGINDDFIVQ